MIRETKYKLTHRALTLIYYLSHNFDIVYLIVAIVPYYYTSYLFITTNIYKVEKYCMEFNIKDEKLFNVANEWCATILLAMFSPERIIGC